MSMETALTDVAPWITPKGVPGLVSVIIPTYNRAHLIGDTLNSVFKQTHGLVEVLVIDDGSNDHTDKIIEEWTDRLGREKSWELRFFKQQRKGPSAARNKGIRESRGEFINFLDSDDLFLKNKLEVQSKFLNEHSKFGAVYAFSEAFLLSDPHKILKELYYDPEDKLAFILATVGGAISNEALLWRRSALAKIGPWDERLKNWEDGDLQVRFFSEGFELGCIRQVLSRYSRHSDSLTHGDAETHYASILPALRKTYAMLALGRKNEYARLLGIKTWLQTYEAWKYGYAGPYQELMALLSEIRENGHLPTAVKLGCKKDGAIRSWAAPLSFRYIKKFRRRMRKKAEKKPEA